MQKNNSFFYSSYHKKGSSLIEVLVAVAILSFGLLSVAMLQINAVEATSDAGQRTIASHLAQDMLERMRINKNNGVNVYLDDYITSVGGNSPSSAPANPDCTTTCTGTQLAQADLYQWQQALRGAAETRSGANTGGIQSPTGCITGPVGGTAGDPGVYTVTIVWRGNKRLTNSNASTCGNGTGLYDAANANDHEYRRIMSMSSFITPGGSGI